MTGLQAWISEQVVADEMLWKGSFGRQVGFIRDKLVPLVGTGLDYEDTTKIATVISTHRSKSIALPVVQIERCDLGLRVVMRDNFYNWKLSVLSEKPIVADFTGLFHTTPPIAPDYTGNPLATVYFEGFPERLVFDYYAPSDKRRWSAEIYGDHDLWATLFLIMRSLGAVAPFKWHTPESHRAALDASTARRKAREAAKTG